MSKAIYHSGLVKMSPFTAQFTSDVLDSKFKKAGTPSKFVCFKIGNDEYSHSIENDACVQSITGLKGQTVTVIASGSREDAAIQIQGAGETPQQPAPAQRPASQPHSAPPPQPAPRSALQTIHGATVGMAINQAIGTMNAIGTDWFTTLGQKELLQRASAIIRISQSLEAGQLAPKNTKPETDDVPM